MRDYNLSKLELNLLNYFINYFTLLDMIIKLAFHFLTTTTTKISHIIYTTKIITETNN